MGIAVVFAAGLRAAAFCGVLTDAGLTLKEYAEKLLNLRNDAQEALVEMRELQKGKLVMAANEFTALYLLPVLAEFRRLHPMIRITVRRALGSTIPDDVLKHNVRQRRSFGPLFYLDLFFVLLGAYGRCRTMQQFGLLVGVTGK